MYDDSDEAAEVSKAWHDHKAKSTPAVPMEEWFRQTVRRLNPSDWWSVERGEAKAALWAAVVAYGDRRAEEARFAAMSECADIADEADTDEEMRGAGYAAQDIRARLAALSSPAPGHSEEGAKDGNV